MYQLLAGTFLISLFHALIPSHWLPLVSLAKIQNWSERETIRIAFGLGLAHVLSTVLLGLILGTLFYEFNLVWKAWDWLGPAILLLSGFYFMYRHHKHHHFHIDDHMMDQTKTRKQIIYALMAFMFLSPCLEIEAYFVNASLQNGWLLFICILIYIVISLLGTVLWILFAFRGLQQINSHKWEHNAGIITGLTMVITGLLSFLIHN
jgi:threonine/homoserine/homoserine lactone efflux protein